MSSGYSQLKQGTYLFRLKKQRNPASDIFAVCRHACRYPPCLSHTLMNCLKCIIYYNVINLKAEDIYS